MKPFYREGNWEYPKSRGSAPKKLLKSEKEAKREKATTPLREKNTAAAKSTRKNATPQRYNRQLAALSGGTPKRGTPSRKKIISSTFAQKDDDTADFVSIGELKKKYWKKILKKKVLACISVKVHQ